MGILDEMLEGKKSIVILGHVNPDGDCIGSCLGLYNYLKENYEGLEVSVYLEKMGVKFSFLSGFEDVHTEYDDTKTFDLCITSDASDVPRLGVFAPYRETAKDTFCVDHHITNKGMCRQDSQHAPQEEDPLADDAEVLYRFRRCDSHDEQQDDILQDIRDQISTDQFDP